MARQNPSAVLTLIQVDDAIDLIMKGRKYCSPNEVYRYPSPKIAMQLGIAKNSGALETYIHERWHLTSTGRTRRTNNLRTKIERLASELVNDDDIVWKIGTWKGTIGFVAAASEPAARALGWSMFAWVHEYLKGKTSNELYIEKVSAGGWKEAATSNISLVNTLQSLVKNANDDIAAKHKTLETYKMRIETLTQAIMMCGPEGTNEEMNAQEEEE